MVSFQKEKDMGMAFINSMTEGLMKAAGSEANSMEKAKLYYQKIKLGLGFGNTGKESNGLIIILMDQLQMMKYQIETKMIIIIKLYT